MDRVTVRVVEVGLNGSTANETSCAVEVEGQRHENVLVPFFGIMVGHQFTARKLTSERGETSFDEWRRAAGKTV